MSCDALIPADAWYRVPNFTGMKEPLSPPKNSAGINEVGSSTKSFTSKLPLTCGSPIPTISFTCAEEISSSSTAVRYVL